MTLREAEQRYGVPRATRLSRKYRGVQVLRPGRQKVLNEHGENVIVSAKERAANWGYPSIQIRGNMRRFKENLPENDWLQSFLKRHHELTVRLAPNIKRYRSEITAEKCLSDVDPETLLTMMKQT